MVERVPPEVEAKYTKYVKLRDTLSAITQERVTLEGAISEIDDVLDKVSRLSADADLYRLVGYVMVKSSRDEVVAELRGRREELELRLKAVKSQEEYLRREVDRLASELRTLLGGSGGAGAGG
ncbi:MAG: prefoldin subunit beta [Acidilobaceae archaeon]|nr:prefoldin subunit beta [Desulfurococcaceae archaeon]MCC6060955.1 prefoldin subunit beta [Desulfurococcaceae archaeon]MDT7866681.1 prefoldin subunit beta [Desulfurococcales archaeon]